MLIRSTFSNGVVVYQSPRLLQMGLKHAFSTRIGGVSPPPFDGLNLGNSADSDCQDSADNIAENYRRLLDVLHLLPGRRAWVRQVHGCGVALLCTQTHQPHGTPGETAASGIPPEFQGKLDADAIICDQPGVAVTMGIADCLPILLAAEHGRVVAAIHVGWRGLVAGVIGQTIGRLEQMGIQPEEIAAAIGPGIGRDCFTVGEDVTAEFVRVRLDRVILHNPGRQDRIDLNMAVRTQLKRMGVWQIDFGDQCTYRDSEEFFSHRRDHGRTGRMAAVISAATSADQPV